LKIDPLVLPAFAAPSGWLQLRRHPRWIKVKNCNHPNCRSLRICSTKLANFSFTIAHHHEIGMPARDKDTPAADVIVNLYSRERRIAGHLMSVRT
jgi:hypothetical protein